MNRTTEPRKNRGVRQRRRRSWNGGDGHGKEKNIYEQNSGKTSRRNEQQKMEAAVAADTSAEQKRPRRNGRQKMKAAAAETPVQNRRGQKKRETKVEGAAAADTKVQNRRGQEETGDKKWKQQQTPVQNTRARRHSHNESREAGDSSRVAAAEQIVDTEQRPEDIEEMEHTRDTQTLQTPTRRRGERDRHGKTREANEGAEAAAQEKWSSEQNQIEATT
jgi:hypothetical protein